MATAEIKSCPFRQKVKELSPAPVYTWYRPESDPESDHQDSDGVLKRQLPFTESHLMLWWIDLRLPKILQKIFADWAELVALRSQLHTDTSLHSLHSHSHENHLQVGAKATLRTFSSLLQQTSRSTRRAEEATQQKQPAEVKTMKKVKVSRRAIFSDQQRALIRWETHSDPINILNLWLWFWHLRGGSQEETFDHPTEEIQSAWGCDVIGPLHQPLQ